MTLFNIKNHFINNPKWKKVYMKRFPEDIDEKNYPDFSNKYVENSILLFKENGYSFHVIERMKSKKFSCCVIAAITYDLNGPNENEILLWDWSHESQAYEQMLVSCICHYDIDFSTFK